MDIIEKVRQRILKFLKLDHLAGNPNDERYTYIMDPEEINQQDMEKARVWYVGSSQELLNYYTNQDSHGFAKESAYNRNDANYFWGISSAEGHIKRVHSGVPHAIVDTLCNAVGVPEISASDGKSKYDLSELIRRTNFKEIYMQQQLPLTMAVGWGAWKVVVDVDKKLSEWPILQFYEAKDVEFVVKSGLTLGVIFKNYYAYDKKNYLLLETRRINEKGNSAIEYELYRLDRNDEVREVPLDTIPALANLQDVEIPGYKHILAVPCRFIFDPNNKNYGRSIYYGKYDLFDDLDQSLSQRSQTCRVSTPVEYFSPDVLERGANGQPNTQKVYNRQYVMKSGIPDGDGKVDNSIQTTQPALNFDQYSQEQKAILDFILTGILSPATMGIDVAKKDNADAQREKEKVTIMTRNTIIASETQILKELFQITMAMKDYMDGKGVSLADYDVSVKFSGFANPSFEGLSQVLTPMWQAGAISDEMFVNKLYGDSLSAEEKKREIEALKANRERDTADLEALMGDRGENADGETAETSSLAD